MLYFIHHYFKESLFLKLVYLMLIDSLILEFVLAIIYFLILDNPLVHYDLSFDYTNFVACLLS